MILTALYAVAFAATGIGRRTSYHYRYFTASGQCYPDKPSEDHIAIAATNNVNDKALLVACHTLAKITRFMPHEVFVSTSKSDGVGIFTMDETLAAYPVNAALVDQPQCSRRCDGSCKKQCTSDGRTWAEVPGITNSISLSNMESVLCLPRDVYRRKENIIVHEFAHLVHMYMDKQWKNKISAAYQNAQQHKLWPMNSYPMANKYEYFAVASEGFLGSIVRTDIGATGRMNLCNSSDVCGEADTREFFKKYDPMIFEVLAYAYTDNDISKLNGIDPCEK